MVGLGAKRLQATAIATRRGERTTIEQQGDEMGTEGNQS
jgi:hypothetical protein